MPFPPSAIEAQRERGRRQRSLALTYIEHYIAEHGWAPSVREVAGVLGVNISTAHEHLRILAEDGRIVKGPGPRMMRIAAGGSIRVP